MGLGAMERDVRARLSCQSNVVESTMIALLYADSYLLPADHDIDRDLDCWQPISAIE